MNKYKPVKKLGFHDYGYKLYRIKPIKLAQAVMLHNCTR
jgi:hypothetical protein